MDGEEMYHAVLEALTDHHKRLEEDASRLSAGIMAIAPFDAETADDESVSVVGIVSNPIDGCLDFVVLKTLEGGEMIPTTEGSVWPLAKRKAA
ncbi:hypothetical protein [Mesorhizobium sp. CO1-1-9]|uniref:hypothetical protein n=1 Tax=Mesorhizobium sp. CO1-1-9 TaxID=2876630 RepID=UPI001CC9E7BF|nr:hypothetical protein [Mesorhizobium sp. CO1-1-9]MBZ9698812.1 hypothetical protein [Mesorhizobium sp. CO1-1-9]